MKKSIFTLALAAIASVSVAQTSTEFGYNLGFSSYLGDLQNKQYSYQNPGIATGVFVRENINSWMAFRGFFNYARISGSDADSRVQGQIQRNLSFRTFIAEFGGQVEFSILPFDKFNPSNNRNKQYFNWAPYATIGLNVFHYNPKTLYKGEWVALQPLNTEGQNSSFNSNQPYKLTQAAVPIAFGLKYQPAKRITLAIEFGARKTFTDYLDDVSGSYADQTKLTSEKGYLAAELAYRTDELDGNQGTSPVANSRRGNSNNKDWYLINTFSFTYKLYSAKKAFSGR
jgi:hypothetical protein